jgi:hypothetical protein
MGLLAAVRLVAKLFLRLIAGVWVHHLRHRPPMIGADLDALLYGRRFRSQRWSVMSA